MQDDMGDGNQRINAWTFPRNKVFSILYVINDTAFLLS